MMAFSLEPLHLSRFVTRQHACQHTLDAELYGDRPCGPLVVAGEQNGLDADFVEMPHGGLRRGLDRVGDRDDAEQYPFRFERGDPHHGSALLFES